VDEDRVWESLQLAGLKEEVERMQFGIHTLVGDMGGNLSGGQRQRVLLARIFYKNPRLLLLDEATSHLDVQREAEVLSALKQRRTTVVMVAHRPETIAAAGRILELTPTTVVERLVGHDPRPSRPVERAI
jgi:ATP-binding cassette subfamily B protein RaxB